MKSLIRDHKNLIILLILLGLVLSQAWYFFQKVRYEEELSRFTSYHSGLLNQPREEIDTIRITDPGTNETTVLHRPNYFLISLAGCLIGFLLGIKFHSFLKLIKNRKKKRKNGR